MKITKKDQLAFLKEKLATDARWALRGLVVIYQQQTDQEKGSRQTIEENGVGFTGVDAAFLSSLAQQFQKWGTLSEKQMAIVHKKMVRYAGQLLRFTNSEKLLSAMQK